MRRSWATLSSIFVGIKCVNEHYKCSSLVISRFLNGKSSTVKLWSKLLHSSTVSVSLLQCFSLPECLLWHDRCALTDPQFARSLLHITHTPSHQIFTYSKLNELLVLIVKMINSMEIEFASTKPAMFSSFPEAWVVLLYWRLPFRRKHNEVGKTNLQHKKSTDLEKLNWIATSCTPKNKD